MCELLTSARQQRGITLQHIADETKIPLRHLAALEREDLSALPGGFYRKAEVRAFARAVGVDDRLALGCLERLEAPAPCPETPTAPLPKPRSLTRARLELVIGLGFVALVVFGRVLWERRAMRGPEGRPAAVDLTGGAVAPASLLSEDARAGTPGLQVVQSALPAVPVEAAAQAPETAAIGTELSIVTEPRGGRVTVDGIGWGETPVTILHLPPGHKRIRVTLDGYDSVERIVQTTEGRSNHVTIRLRQP